MSGMMLRLLCSIVDPVNISDVVARISERVIIRPLASKIRYCRQYKFGKPITRDCCNLQFQLGERHQ